MDDEHDSPPESSRFRLGENEDWLPREAVQRLLDILHERNRPYLGALLAEALTGEPPKIRRPR